MSRVFAPGCAMMIYKPELARRILEFLNRLPGTMPEHLTCCHHQPNLAPGTQVVITCPGCDRRYRQLYEGISTISLWEVLAESTDFPFPDYQGQEMAIHDACPTRTEDRVHNAVRKLLKRMNVKVVEPKHTRTQSICCGDDFYPELPVEAVKEQMKKRAGQMPVDDVVVYCVSCVKSMHIGGKRPRYMADLLFGEETVIGVYEPDQWHAQVDKYIEEH